MEDTARIMSPMVIHRLPQLTKERGAKRALADALGKPPSVISELCSGKDRLNDDLIASICTALRIPVWQLFADPVDVIPKEYLDLMADYKSLDDDSKRIVDAMLLAARHRARDGEGKKNGTA